MLDPVRLEFCLDRPRPDGGSGFDPAVVIRAPGNAAGHRSLLDNDTSIDFVLGDAERTTIDGNLAAPRRRARPAPAVGVREPAGPRRTGPQQGETPAFVLGSADH